MPVKFFRITKNGTFMKKDVHIYSEIHGTFFAHPKMGMQNIVTYTFICARILHQTRYDAFVFYQLLRAIHCVRSIAHTCIQTDAYCHCPVSFWLMYFFPVSFARTHHTRAHTHSHMHILRPQPRPFFVALAGSVNIFHLVLLPLCLPFYFFDSDINGRSPAPISISALSSWALL